MAKLEHGTRFCDDDGRTMQVYAHLEGDVYLAERLALDADGRLAPRDAELHEVRGRDVRRWRREAGAGAQAAERRAWGAGGP